MLVSYKLFLISTDANEFLVDKMIDFYGYDLFCPIGYYTISNFEILPNFFPLNIHIYVYFFPCFIAIRLVYSLMSYVS